MMLNWLIGRKLATFERKYAYDMGYAREMLAADPRALWAFSKVQAMSGYRRDVPRDPYWCTKLVATVAEDCGPCTQLVVAMALEDGADPQALSATLTRDDTALGEDARLAVRFARMVLAHAPEADEHRATIVQRWGNRALVSLAFAITSARIFPTLKYALGHGQACQRVVVAGTAIPVSS